MDPGRLTPVEETSLLTVYARALDFDRPHPILGDEVARRVVDQVDYDFAGLGVLGSTERFVALRAKMLDASIGGLGRGAGNCQMELLLSFLHNPKFKLRPVLQCLQETVEPMRAELRWGYAIPYMVTGYMNQHPKDAMEFMEGKDYLNFVKFYDAMTEET